MDKIYRVSWMTAVIVDKQSKRIRKERFFTNANLAREFVGRLNAAVQVLECADAEAIVGQITPETEIGHD